MRVLFQGRPDLFSVSGGDTIQIKNTMKQLEALGVAVEFDSDPDMGLGDYDLVHLSNLTRPYHTLLQLQNAKSQRKPAVLSTIYWSMDDLISRLNQQRKPFRSRFRIVSSMARRAQGFFSKSALRGYREWQVMSKKAHIKKAQLSVIDQIDTFLPNSVAEMELLRQDFGISAEKPFRIICNGIDDGVFQRSVALDWEKMNSYGIATNSGFLLCVGRIELRKNQLGLVKATADLDMPLVLVGKPGISESYVDSVRSLMKPQDVIIPGVPYHDLAPIYSCARVHVLPSYYETPGLSSLEAGACGCNLVMSAVGSQKEYFGNLVEYCDADSVSSICLAIERALERPWPNMELAHHVRTNFTWQMAARQTLEAYHEVLAGL